MSIQVMRIAIAKANHSAKNIDLNLIECWQIAILKINMKATEETPNGTPVIESEIRPNTNIEKIEKYLKRLNEKKYINKQGKLKN